MTNTQLSKRHFQILLFAVFVCLLGWAWVNRFVYDDAFISFRYARHLSEGYGLVWNINETPIEGYTNFLWTLLMSLAFIIGIDPIIFSWGISLICFLLSLILTYQLTTQFTDKPYWGLIASILLGINVTFNAFATSGLETQLQAMLVLLATYQTHRFYQSKTYQNQQLALISLTFSALLLTRLDSAIMIGILGSGILYHLLRQDTLFIAKTRQFIALALPFLFLIGSWLLWKLSFYGDILPNTFYAKVGVEAFVLARGVIYLLGFWLSYWLFPFPFLIAWATTKRKLSLLENQLVIILGLWTAYLLYVGGDHMEFRFMVPVLPLLIILIISVIAGHITHSRLQLILVLLIISGTISHRLTFDQSPFKTHQLSINDMILQRINPDEDWDAIGQTLGESFNFDHTVTIAINPAGWIPYYSQARTIDMLGLNDAWVARNGVPYLTMAAHEQIATFDYLLSRGVNLLIDQPKMIPDAQNWTPTSDSIDLFHVGISVDDVPDNTVFLLIPINDTHSLLTLYLFQHPTINEAIQTFNWQTYPIKPS